MSYGYMTSGASGGSGGNWWDGLFGGGGSSGGSSSGGGTDWYGALLGGLSSYSDGKQRGKDVDRAGQWQVRGIQEGGRQSRGNSEFEAGLADYYRRSLNQERRQGLSNYGSMARNEYNNVFTPAPVGAAPTANAFEATFNPPPPKK